MRLSDTPIRRKLIFIMLLTSVVVMLLMRGTFFTYELLALRERLVQQVTTLGEVIASNSSAALAFRDEEDAATVLASLQSSPFVTAAALYDQRGALFVRYPAKLPASVLPTTLHDPGATFQG